LSTDEFLLQEALVFYKSCVSAAVSYPHVR
jgi:hypothetical protein